jgi:putative transposase
MQNIFKGLHFHKDVVLLCVIFYLKFPLSTRALEEIVTLRNLSIDHATINRWVIKFSAYIEKNFRKRTQKFTGKYYVDETYVKVKGKDMYLYRAIDRNHKTVDFYFSSRRDKKAAVRFFERMFKRAGTPEEVTMDKSGANLAGINEIKKRRQKKGQPPIKIRQIKHLNNRLEQDHRTIKRKTAQIQTFKSFYSAKYTLAGVEVAHAKTKSLKRTGDYCLQNLINEIKSLVA